MRSNICEFVRRRFTSGITNPIFFLNYCTSTYYELRYRWVTWTMGKSYILTPFSHEVRPKLQNATCYNPYILFSLRPHRLNKISVPGILIYLLPT